MTLTKAIDTVKWHRTHLSSNHNRDINDALKLLIEAGKRLKKIRGWDTFDHVLLLPGETP